MRAKNITVAFNRDNLAHTSEILWAFTYRKESRRYLVYTLLPLPFLFVGFVFDLGFFKLLGVLLGLFILLKWINLYEIRRKYFKESKSTALGYEERNVKHHYTFSEEVLEFKNEEVIYTLSWSVFSHFVLFRNTILIVNKADQNIFATISKFDLTDEDYLDVLEIIKAKLPEKG